MSELELVSLPDEFSSSETGINTMKIHCTYKRDGEYSGETCGCAEFEFPAGPEPADVNHKPPRQHEIQVMHLPIGEKEGGEKWCIRYGQQESYGNYQEAEHPHGRREDSGKRSFNSSECFRTGIIHLA